MDKVIGKPYIGQLGYYTYLNEFGRDSLRIILEALKDKKFAVPDLHCPVVRELLDTIGIDYTYYHIDKGLQIEWKTVKEHDVLYHINNRIGYSLENNFNKEKILLEDAVFKKDFGNVYNAPNYIGFNSWRKCTPLHCGSMIKSTIPLKDSYWRMPPDQVALLQKCKETKYRTFVLNNRDEVQKKLAKEDIFLPVFWRGCPNELSNKVLSVPIDDRYTKEEIERVEQLINKYQS